MSKMVIYDSQYGNTQRIAEAVARGLSGAENASAVRLDRVTSEDISGVDFLVVGSPTQGFTATEKTRKWLDNLPPATLQGVKAACFDTRFTEQKIAEVGILSFLVSIFGYAAEPISKRLAKKGAELIADPIGFYVADTEGPLLDREIERAEEWARGLDRSGRD